MKLDKTNSNYISDIKQIVSEAKTQVYSVVNSTMVKAYWLIGKRIVEEEQEGKERASYGKQIIDNLSKELTVEFGRGFSTTNIRYFRNFYQVFSIDTIRHLVSGEFKGVIHHLTSGEFNKDENAEIFQLIFTKLSWTHIRQIMRVKNIEARNYYIKESVNNAWSVETLDRKYFIDLVFYNYILKCFVLIDLKTERITHQDVGQMDMYVRMYNENIKAEDDNPTIGIVLCSETDSDIAKYSILKDNEQIFASKYKLYLPTEEELRAEIEREKINFKLQFGQNNE